MTLTYRRWFLLVPILLAVCFGGPVGSSCSDLVNEDEGDDDDDSDDEGTEDQATDALDVSIEVGEDALVAVVPELDSGEDSVNEASDSVLSAMREVLGGGDLKADVEESSDDCDAGDVPDESDLDDFGSIESGDGSCDIFSDIDPDDPTEGDVLVDCSVYEEDEVTINGQIGISNLEITDDGVTGEAGSDGLEMTFDDETTCDVALNFTFEYDGSSGEFEVDGCVSICGTAFEVSGEVEDSEPATDAETEDDVDDDTDDDEDVSFALTQGG